MRIGLIDVDGHNYPNLPLMKLSAWHKAQGDSVEWYEPMFSGHMDIVYMSKVFGFTPDYEYYVDADIIKRGGTGYCISLVDGVEIFDESQNENLPDEIEHIYPDYGLYPDFKDTAIGYLTRGCPRDCSFCHVAKKEGRRSYKVADLDEFWRGQKRMDLCDPNMLACPDAEDLLQQLIDSKASVDFTQGFDIRLMTERKAELISKIKLSMIHFAWDNPADREIILPKFKMFKEITGISERKNIVYCITNAGSTHEEDLERVYTLRDMGYWAYITIYDKAHAPRRTKQLQRWVNNRICFATFPTFDEYLKAGV